MNSASSRVIFREFGFGGGCVSINFREDRQSSMLFPGVLAIRTWACWGGTNGSALAWFFGCCLIKSQREYSCTSSWILSGVSFLDRHGSVQADCETVWTPLPDSGSNSCFVVYCNQLLGNWFVLLVGEGGALRPTTISSVAHQGSSRSDPHGHLRLPEL